MVHQSTKKNSRRLGMLSVLLALTVLLLSACATPEGLLTVDPTTVGQTQPVQELEQVEPLEQQVIEAEDIAEAVLPEGVVFQWQGAFEDATCGELTVDAEGVGRVGPCNAEEPGQEWQASHAAEWETIVAHFGQLNYLWGDESLNFYGEGATEGVVWAEALGVWARFVYMESVAGQTTSAVRTALAWQVADESAAAVDVDLADDTDVCGRLTVTRYGYAYASLEPCVGGPAEALAEGWLTTAEMTQLVDWLGNWEPVYDEAGYVDGQGDGLADANDVAAVASWSEGVFTRLSAQ